MQILALETTSSVCSVALRRDDTLIEDTRNVQRMHNRMLLGMIEGVCRALEVDRRAFDVIGFGAGPGSFTGVRMAAAVAQGIAFAATSPAGALVCPVSSSLAAARVAADLSLDERGVVVCTRSRRDSYYLAAYEFIDDGVRPPGVRQVREDALQHSFPAWVDGAFAVVGDEPSWLLPEGVRYAGPTPVTAPVILTLAEAAWRRGEGVPPALALPRYVAGDHPWRPGKPPKS